MRSTGNILASRTIGIALLALVFLAGGAGASGSPPSIPELAGRKEKLRQARDRLAAGDRKDRAWQLRIAGRQDGLARRKRELDREAARLEQRRKQARLPASDEDLSKKEEALKREVSEIERRIERFGIPTAPVRRPGETRP